ncbi:MAG: hypothetical protein ACOCV2_11520 [Persicimonas sp.]
MFRRLQGMFVKIVVVGAMLALVAGCSDEESDNNTDSNNEAAEPMSQEEFTQAWGEVLCARAFDCCDEDQLETFLAQEEIEEDVETEEECVPKMVAKTEEGLEIYEESLDEGRIEFNEDEAGECIAWAKEQDCTGGIYLQVEDLPEACMDYVTGTLEVDEECYDLGECRDGTCVGYETNSDGETNSPGTCEPLGEEDGDTCYGLETCEGDLYCDMGGDEEEGTCREPAAAGESCEEVECEWNSYCNAESTCEEYLENGEECESSDECASDHCADQNDEGVGTCEADPDADYVACTPDGT